MFFKKDNNKNKVDFLIKICALLVHAAKIDEDYTENEEEIIRKTLLELGAPKEDLSLIVKKARIIEENSTQILDFTKKVKK